MIASIFRKPLLNILSNINSLTYKDFNMMFSDKLDSIETTLENQAVPTINHIPNTKDKEIINVAEISPAASITMSWSTLEQEILNTIKRLALSPDYPVNNSPFKNINLLLDSGKIDFETKNNIEELRQLRNKAVHQGPDITLNTNDALKYHRLTKSIIGILKNINR